MTLISHKGFTIVIGWATKQQHRHREDHKTDPAAGLLMQQKSTNADQATEQNGAGQAEAARHGW